MSLPVTAADAALAKLTAAFTLFLIPATIAATALVLAGADRYPRGHGGIAPPDMVARARDALVTTRSCWALWILFFSIVLGAAIVSESIGWTIGVLTGLLFVFGNFALQVLPTLPGVGRYMRALGRGQAALPITIACELAAIAAIVGIILMLQRRKTSFV